jgi:hypothetical protein
MPAQATPTSEERSLLCVADVDATADQISIAVLTLAAATGLGDE